MLFSGSQVRVVALALMLLGSLRNFFLIGRFGDGLLIERQIFKDLTIGSDLVFHPIELMLLSKQNLLFE